MPKTDTSIYFTVELVSPVTEIEQWMAHRKDYLQALDGIKDDVKIQFNSTLLLKCFKI